MYIKVLKVYIEILMDKIIPNVYESTSSLLISYIKYFIFLSNIF